MTRQKPPVITAGDCEPHTWCGTCQAPSRVRLNLHDGTPGGPLLAVVEVCPGCGSNHATPRVEVVPASPGLIARLRSAGQRDPAELCAHGDCRKRAEPGITHSIAGDEGTWTYRFCSRPHRQAWADANWIALPPADRAKVKG